MKKNYFMIWNQKYMARLDKKEEAVLRPALEYHRDHVLKKFFSIWKIQYTKSKIEHVNINIYKYLKIINEHIFV